ncbi:MAG: hypothetical protein ABI619_02695, partial [Betaproteobacteria bacterium]
MYGFILGFKHCRHRIPELFGAQSQIDDLGAGLLQRIRNKPALIEYLVLITERQQRGAGAFPFANVIAMLVGGALTAALAVPNANPFGVDNMFGYMNGKQAIWLSVL